MDDQVPSSSPNKEPSHNDPAGQVANQATRIRHSHTFVYLSILLLMLAAAISLMSYSSHRHKVIISKPNLMKVTGPAVVVGPYAGWKTYCADVVAACIRYPANWTGSAGSPGDFVNPGGTTDVSLIPWTNQNQTPNSAYIYSVISLTTSATPLDIVGYIVSDQPGYVVYDASYVTAKGITADTTERIVDGNYAFSGKKGTISLVATPYADAYTAITTLSQAKAWFVSPNGQIDLQILQSLYYQ